MTSTARTPRMAMAPIQRSVTSWKCRQSRPAGLLDRVGFGIGNAAAAAWSAPPATEDFYWNALMALTRVSTIPQTSGMLTKPQARARLIPLLVPGDCRALSITHSRTPAPLRPRLLPRRHAYETARAPTSRKD